MRYVIVDMDGASRDYFSRRDDVREALRELEDEHPGIADDLLVMSYGDDGQRIGEPEPAVEVLASVVLEPLSGLGVGATRFLITDLWTVLPSTDATSATASDRAWPGVIPSTPVPTRPYEYESEATAIVA
jgi:hypothetical protein